MEIRYYPYSYKKKTSFLAILVESNLVDRNRTHNGHDYSYTAAPRCLINNLIAHNPTKLHTLQMYTWSQLRNLIDAINS